MKNLMNGMQVRGLRGGTIFVRLPAELQATIEGGSEQDGWANACCCEYCKRHPNERPMWDTLAIPADGKGNTWTVHMPGGIDR